MPIKLTSDSIQAIASLISKKNILIKWYDGDGVPRADIKSNVVWLPRIGTEDDNDLRVFSWHEAGHHRHTKRAGDDFESNKIKFDILNGLEDVRMESLVKRDYPGTISVFREVDTRMYEKTKENMEGASSPEWARKLLSLMFWAKGFPELQVCDDTEKKLMMKAAHGSFTVCKTCAAALFEKWKAEFEAEKQKQAEQPNGSGDGEGQGQGDSSDSNNDESQDSNNESSNAEGQDSKTTSSSSSSQNDNGQHGFNDFDDEKNQKNQQSGSSSTDDAEDENDSAEKDEGAGEEDSSKKADEESQGADEADGDSDEEGKDDSNSSSSKGDSNEGEETDDSNNTDDSSSDDQGEDGEGSGERKHQSNGKEREQVSDSSDVSHQSDGNGFHDNFDDDSLIQEAQNFLKDSLIQKQKDYMSGEGVQDLESYPRVEAKVRSLTEFVAEKPWVLNNHSQLRDNHQKLIGVIQNSIQAKMKAKTTRFLKEGEVDSFLLDRVRTSDRIFYRREQKKQNKVAVSMVIDASGSMSYEMWKALYVATTIGKCLASIGVNYEIVTQSDTFYGYTVNGTLRSIITEIKGFNRAPTPAAAVNYLTAYSNGRYLCGNNFADSEAVNLARIRLNKITAKRRIILMMTDGCACVGGIGSESLEKMSKHEINKCKRDGVEVYAVGINTMRNPEFRRIYDNAEGCIDVDVNKDDDALITDVLPLFKEFILKKMV